MDEYRGRDLRRLVLTTNHVVEETHWDLPPSLPI